MLSHIGKSIVGNDQREQQLFNVPGAPRTAKKEGNPHAFVPTPIWFATFVFEKYFSKVGSGDVVLDPCAGAGHFLAAIDASIPAYGIEIDPDRASRCASFTGRRVIVGDFLNITLDVLPTAIVTSPPFFIAREFLNRAYQVLPEGGRVGFILPVSTLSYSRAVRELNDRWSIRVDLIPRDIYPREGQTVPLMFAVFDKNSDRILTGLAGFPETASVRDMPARFRSLLNERPAPRVWREVVYEALDALGGSGSLTQINMVIEGRGYARGSTWRDKVRQICGLYCNRLEPGHFQRPQSAAA